MENLLLIFLIKIYTNQANDKDNLTRLGNIRDSTRTRLEAATKWLGLDLTRKTAWLAQPCREIPGDSIMRNQLFPPWLDYFNINWDTYRVCYFLIQRNKKNRGL